MRIKRMRPIGLLAAMALLTGTAALPAAAEELTEQIEAGVAEGEADVGKTWLRDISAEEDPPELVQDDKACDWKTKSFPDGVDGQGLFLPDDGIIRVDQNKNSVFHIVFDDVVSEPSQFNRLEACGKIHPVSAENTMMADEKLKKDEENPRNPWHGKLKHDDDHGPLGSVGPACGMSKGKGWGELSGSAVGDPDVNFRFFWPATAGGTLPIEGKWEDKPANGKTGTLVAVFQAQGGLDCLDAKTDDPKDETGATNFIVVGQFEAVAADAKLH